MKHMCAWFSSLANSLTNQAMTPVPDIFLPTRGNTLVLPENWPVQRAYMFGATLTQGRINVPTFRAITYPRVYPIEKASTISNNPPILDWNGHGPTILATEGVGLDASTTTGGSNPDATYGFLWLGRNMDDAPPGQAYTMGFTAAATLATGQWVNTTPTFEQDLPAGRYAIIGAEAYGTGLWATRFNFPGQVTLPGILCQQAAGEFDQGSQRFGRMGMFGSFLNTSPPTMWFLGTTGGTSQTGYVDLVRIGDR